MGFYLGIDFGTSGARAIVIDAKRQIQAERQLEFTESSDWSQCWQTTLFQLIEQIPVSLRRELSAIALNGTSSTVLLCDRSGNPITPPLLYNDARGRDTLEEIRAVAPPQQITLSATSSLAKLRWWYHHLQPADTPLYFLHQADWLAFQLHGKLGVSDYHNALKLGYDVENLCYPEWLEPLTAPFKLPQVLAPGTPVGEILPPMRDRFHFPPDCLVCAGTTDSIAAFLASGATSPGEAVTSLGSTLVIKLLSHTRIDEAASGIYSHRLGNLWLVGGASNTGGAVLRHFFSDVELAELSQQINPEQPSPLDYYPLLQPGDRFPINDPNLPPRLEPRPNNPVDFLQGLLEGIARIEALGYQRLQALGATPLTRVYTAGGGAKNLTWMRMRDRYLNVPVIPSPQTEAAYGSALLSYKNFS
ncbi:FGGY-family carbohydrate kinase [Geitlerinema calcuttense]|uniref:FGGY-family carbohydrate kinase n=1 Tax=Geitlerinema calcuttense NRMC-F 0142 TaxID=2922238 RepID=A0ABT7M1U9_9CYAN|nr:FGGY-family carbohydrate kinase [Geitlerinema calcuttense]MDL5057031.1 FGGY-family carbohydrate kinase [Geitlerinema calcuttense NRMC-F 0142]